jgi:hypothetical protein
MSYSPFFTRNSADNCAIAQKDGQNMNAFGLMVDSSVIESDETCFQAAAPFKHNPFKSVPKNVVDVESELRGQSRVLSHCPSVTNKMTTYPSLPVNECKSNNLVAEHTRINKPCNIFSGININRFHPLCEDLQNLNKIQSNGYIGINTRLYMKDEYRKKQQKK